MILHREPHCHGLAYQSSDEFARSLRVREDMNVELTLRVHRDLRETRQRGGPFARALRTMSELRFQTSRAGHSRCEMGIEAFDILYVACQGRWRQCLKDTHSISSGVQTTIQNGHHAAILLAAQQSPHALLEL